MQYPSAFHSDHLCPFGLHFHSAHIFTNTDQMSFFHSANLWSNFQLGQHFHSLNVFFTCHLSSLDSSYFLLFVRWADFAFLIFAQLQLDCVVGCCLLWALRHITHTLDSQPHIKQQSCLDQHHCVALHYFAIHCNILQCFALFCNVSQYIALFCDILQNITITLYCWKNIHISNYRFV